MTDNEILDGIYSDEASGFAVLIDTYADLLYGIAYSVLNQVGTERDIEECVADTFVAFYNNIYDVDLSRASLKGYLGVISRRRGVNLRYTLRPDDDKVFDEYTVEEMSELLENIQADEIEGLAERIKAQVSGEISPVMPEGKMQEPQYNQSEGAEEYDGDYDRECEEEDESDTAKDADEEYQPKTEAAPERKRSNRNGPIVTESPINRIHPIFKVIPMAIALVLVIVVGVIAFNELSVPKYEEVTTTTTSVSPELQILGSLKDAISLGDEKLIESLVTSSLILSKDVITFAVECADVLSYTTIKSIAQGTKEAFGSTGLDPLLENAILGNTQGVIDELQGKRIIFKTYTQKLAFFFTAAFGESEAIKAFLDKGFELTMKDTAGKTAYEIAEQYGNTENVKEAERLAGLN